MAIATRPLSAEDYFALPLDPRSRITQLIEGELVVNQPNLRHQDLTGEIHRLLANWILDGTGRGRAGIPVDVHLDDRNVYVPDVWWVAEDQLPRRDARRLTGPPTLVVEVRSPSTWRFDIGLKKATYERAGLTELWLVDTEADAVLVFRRSRPGATAFDVSLELGASEVLTSPLLPGFALDLEPLFDR